MDSTEILRRAQRLLTTGEYASAEELCRSVLKKRKSMRLAQRMLADCLYNQGMMHVSFSGLIDEAETCFREALVHNPDHSLALNNLGVIADQKGEPEKALSYYLQACERDAKNMHAMRNVIVTYQKTGKLSAADALLEKMCHIDAENAALYLIRQATSISSIARDHAHIDQMRETVDARLDRCLLARPAEDSPEAFSAPHFFLSYHGKTNKELHQKIARAYLHIAPSLDWVSPHIPMPRQGESRIRVGIVSAHLFNHSIGHTTRGLVEHLDRNVFDVSVIRLGAAPADDIAKAIDAAADQVIKVDDTLHTARARIADLKLDILFYQDIGMEPFSYLLSFSRLAPVQLTSFGHPDTTGVPNMDYFISSSLYETAGAQEHYSEKLVVLPGAGTLSYYIRPQVPEEPVSRAEFGLSDDERLYLCPQTLFKVHPDMDAVFEGIAKRDPGARIVLIEPAGKHMREALESRFAALGEDVASRITFIKRLDHPAYLRLMRCADVMLDTVHFNGQNTNLEAFALRIPVVTWPGTMQRERHTLGMYKAMGQAQFLDLIAENAADYANKAVKVATDKLMREDLQRKIQASAGVLYENIEFVRGMENIFKRLAPAGTPAK